MIAGAKKPIAKPAIFLKKFMLNEIRWEINNTYWSKTSYFWLIKVELGAVNWNGQLIR